MAAKPIILLNQIDSELLRYIVEQDLKPGDRVPSLTELSRELSISVSKLREQLEVARILGIVEVRPRTGIRCQEFDFMPALRLSLFFALANDRRMFDLYSSWRIHTEAAYWQQAAESLTPDDFETLHRLIEQAWAKLRGSHIIIPHTEHRALHSTIFSRLENPFVRGMLDAYWEAYEAVEHNRYAELSYLEDVWQYHQKMVEQLEAGEIEASLQTFLDHTNLLPYQPDSDVKPHKFIGTVVKGKDKDE